MCENQLAHIFYYKSPPILLIDTFMQQGPLLSVEFDFLYFIQICSYFASFGLSFALLYAHKSLESTSQASLMVQPTMLLLKRYLVTTEEAGCISFDQIVSSNSVAAIEFNQCRKAC